MSEKYGIKTKGNKGRELFVEYNGKKYARYPVETPVVNIGDDLDKFIEKYGKPYYKDADIFCISAKVVSIANKYVMHESEVKTTWLARLIVKFVTKWPDDIGYSHPRKMQAAINIVGVPRILLAIFIGTFMKMIGKPGYFYIVAGHNINAIDGFNPVSEPPMNEYAVLPPDNSDELCDKWETKFGMKSVILDGNNIDNNVLGMSKGVKKLFSEEDLMQILRGNPQGQEEDDGITPILILREE
jgi:hypothetical protein